MRDGKAPLPDSTHGQGTYWRLGDLRAWLKSQSDLSQSAAELLDIPELEGVPASELLNEWASEHNKTGFGMVQMILNDPNIQSVTFERLTVTSATMTINKKTARGETPCPIKGWLSLHKA
jgi:hypothetical protein